MRMVWSGAPADEFLPALDRFVRRFDEWARGRGRRVLLPVVEALLHDRWALGDGLLGRWQPDDFAEQFLIRFPRHVTAPAAELGTIITTAQGFVDFLFDEELADERCAGREELKASLGGLADAFVEAMGDESLYGLRKFWEARMIAAGLDPYDEETAERFVADVQSGKIPIDPELLDQVVANHLDDDLEAPPRMPLVILPDPAELRMFAEQSEVVRRIRVLVDLLVAGGPLPEEPDVLAWARAARVVRTVKGRLVRVKAAAKIVAEPQALAQGAFEAFFDLAEDVCGSGPAESLVRRAFADAMLALVMTLYARQGPMSLTDLQDLVYEVSETTVDLDPEEGWGREAADADTVRAVGLLELLGVLSLSGPDVSLTPLGKVLMGRHLREHGVAVPTIGELRGDTAEVVIAAAAEAGPDEREALMSAWVAYRPGTAVEELRALIKRTDDDTHRDLAEAYAERW